MSKYSISLLFILLSSQVFSQIKETTLRMDTKTTPFLEKYYPKQLVRVADDTLLYALTHETKVGMCMQSVFDSGWFKIIGGRGGWFNQILSSGPITTIPSVGYNPGEDISASTWIKKTFYRFVPATITLSGNALYEVGSKVYPSITASFHINGETIFSSGAIKWILSGNDRPVKSWGSGYSTQITTVTFTPIQGVSDSLSKTFIASEFVGNGGSPDTIFSNNVIINSCYPYLKGMSGNDLSGGGTAFYSAMYKEVMNCSSSDTVIYNSDTLQYAYFGYPMTCGPLVSILDHNGFEMITAFTRYVSDVSSFGQTNDWVNVPYYIYKSNNPFCTVGPWVYTFKR